MIYLDNNATTALDPRVVDAMKPLLEGAPLNPSSIHQYGQKAKSLLVKSVSCIAAVLEVKAEELIFTSGATEALNMLVRGIRPKGHIITSSLEHPALLVPIQQLEKEGRGVTYLDPLPGRGSLSRRQVEEALLPETSLIALGAANSETGIRTPFEEIAALAEEAGIPFLVDGVGMLGKAPLSIPRGVSAICFSGHKIHGPHGIGLAAIRKGIKCAPFILGGAQQRGRRGGTENLPAIVGLAKAFQLIQEEDYDAIAALRDRLEKGIASALEDIVVHGKEERRVCNTSLIGFAGVDGENLLIGLDLSKIAVSHGSACSSGSLEPSRVLIKMGVSRQLARSSLRFSLSRFTTRAEIEYCIETVVDKVKQLRSMSGV